MTNDKPPSLVKTPNFIELYANNVRLETSVWDLRLILGALDQSDMNDVQVRVSGTVNIPWRQAKLLAYFMVMNMLYHEASNGHITLPAGLITQDFPVIDELKDDPKAIDLVARINRLREELFDRPLGHSQHAKAPQS